MLKFESPLQKRALSIIWTNLNAPHQEMNDLCQIWLNFQGGLGWKVGFFNDLIIFTMKLHVLSPFEKEYSYSFEQTWITFTFLSTTIEIGQVVLDWILGCLVFKSYQYYFSHKIVGQWFSWSQKCKKVKDKEMVWQIRKAHFNFQIKWAKRQYHYTCTS